MVRTGRRGTDPTVDLDRPRVARGLPRPVEGLTRALCGLRSDFQPIAVFLAETGLRIGEMASLGPIPPGAREALVHGKGGKDRWVPLTAAAVAAYDALPRPLPSRRAIEAEFRRAGFTPHRLRHTLGCELAAAGVDIGDIQAILGHASPATTTVYAAFRLDRLHAAQARRVGAA
jgi:integrase